MYYHLKKVAEIIENSINSASGIFWQNLTSLEFPERQMESVSYKIGAEGHIKYLKFLYKCQEYSAMFK